MRASRRSERLQRWANYKRHVPTVEPPEAVGRTIPRSRYRSYINSPEWTVRREAFLDGSSRGCYGCGRPASDVHHTTYVRLGVERDSDLARLCRDCHDEVHRRHRASDRGASKHESKLSILTLAVIRERRALHFPNETLGRVKRPSR